MIPAFHVHLYIAQKRDGWKDKVMLSYLFKQENGPFERTERKDQGNGFLQPVLDPLCPGEKSNLFIIRLTFHGYDGSFLFQERQTQGEKGLKIGEGS
jgi:hypothetical protein